MSETGERFKRFFSAVNDGMAPYPWQTALVERVAEAGEWPEAIAAPTGSGKTAVIDMHVFLVAERERLRDPKGGMIARPPRRLVMVSPRRLLVDDQFERARSLAVRLAETESEDVVGEVAACLRRLCTTEETEDVMPLGAAQLRGGIRLDLTWRLDPSQCQVICTTPQMWGSRLLMRGYRGSPRTRSLESALLSHDAAVVIDEAHLNERLIETAVRVAERDPISRALQVVAMSATRESGDRVGLTEKDFEDDALASRVRAKKRLRVVEIDDWERKGKVAQEIVEQARRLHGRGTVGVFVNTVNVALEVAGALREKSTTIEIICGRMRPADVQDVGKEWEGLLDSRGNDAVDYLISTQSLEVGADLDLPAMVSMIAPASAIAQRAGRLNRSGKKPDAELVIVAPAGLDQQDTRRLAKTFMPYDLDDIQQALDWIAKLDGDASPEQISKTALPERRRPAMPAITDVELETAAITRNKLAADIDPDFYIEELRDEPDPQVQVAVRKHLDIDEKLDPIAKELHASIIRAALLAAPPRPHELVSLSLGVVEKAIRDATAGSWGARSWIIRSDGGKRSAFAVSMDDGDKKHLPRPNDVIVVPDASEICTERVIRIEGSGRRAAISDVMDKPPEGVTPDVIVSVKADAIADALQSDKTLGSRKARDELAAALDRIGESDVSKRLTSSPRLADLTVTWCGEDDVKDGLLVLTPTRREGVLPRSGASEQDVVTLDAHSAEVRERLAKIIDLLDVEDIGVTREQLLLAAQHHDAGKRHPRFQRSMGAEPGEDLLAKPRPGHKVPRGDGWRHEAISAADALIASPDDPVPAVVVAAHHGHGRPLFGLTAKQMLDQWPDCEQALAQKVEYLFGPCGRYELERAKLQRKIGIHRLAYVEALLRCADIQVSREGK